jgi:hypothetical protein
MRRAQRDEALEGLDGFEHMIDVFAENAKAYWKLWGHLGEPMVHGVDAEAAMQRSYLQWLRQSYRGGTRP